MKVAMTLLVRDEADIIDEWMDWHIGKVDHVYVTDNGSVDGTREKLANWCKRLPLKVTVIDEPEHNFDQPKWVDRMIRMAIADGCDWVANSDADEFWQVNFRDIANNHSNKAIGGYRVKSRFHVATIKDNMSAPRIHKRMPWAVARPRTPLEAQCFASWNKIFHRLDCYAMNVLGNHDVQFTGKESIVDLLEDQGHISHFSERGWDHYRRKYIQGGEAYTNSPLPYAYGFHWRDKYKVYATGGGIVALKKLWRAGIAKNFSCLVLDDKTCG